MTLKGKNQKKKTHSETFPCLPSYSAKWHSLQIEPIQGSGERLTIAVAIKGNDGAVNVFKTANKKILKCLCINSNIADNLFSMINLSIASAEHHLINRVSLDDWNSPITNIFIGRSVDALGKDINDILFQSLNLTSILGSSEQAARAKIEKVIDLRTWKKSVKEKTIKKAPALKNCFDADITLPGGILDAKVGFLLNNFAIDFGIIKSSRETSQYLRQLHFLQGKLWQLDQIRAASNPNNPFLKVNEVELIIKSQKLKDDSISDLIGELQFEAKRKDIPVFQKTDTETSNYIRQRA